MTSVVAPASRWIALIVLSASACTALTLMGLPAALLLGPMLAGIAFAATVGGLELPPVLFSIAQGVIGCMIAGLLPRVVTFGEASRWPIFLAGVLSVIAASAVLGWVMTRMRILPGTTIVWGLSPGAATVLTLMAEASGADVRLVAVLQYMRVVMAAVCATLVARLWGIETHHAAPAVIWFPTIAWVPLFETLGLVTAGVVAQRVFRVSGGSLLVPFLAGTYLSHRGWLTITLPHWMLAGAYACVGWRIGLRFTRPLLIHAARALPRIFACTLALIALCAGLAGILVAVAGIDPLTAYLATSPGGADSVAIIAASTNVDAPFVMAMQTARFVAVLLLAPALARFIAHRAVPAPVV